jgi:hypothetical protein
MWHQISQPTPVTDARSDVPRKLAAVIDRMLMKDPNQRFQLPAELIESLLPWDEGEMMPPDNEMPQLCPAAAAQYSGPRLPPIEAPAPPPRRSSWWHRLISSRRAKTALLLGTVAVAALSGAAAAVVAAH